MDDRAALIDRLAGVRAHRDEFVGLVESGSISLDQIFTKAAHDPVVADTKLLGLLQALPDVGKVQSRRALEQLGLHDHIKVGSVPSAAINRISGALADNILGAR